jgi:transposase
MKERTELLLEWERRWNDDEGDRLNMAELCRMFGVGRQFGYTWVSRYRDANFDPGAVTWRSRRPKPSPYAITPELEDLIVATQAASALGRA